MNAWIEGLHFARPAWLWGLLVLPLLIWWWRARRRDDDVWRSAVDPHLLPHLVERRVGRRGLLSLGGWLLAAICAVVALAGPGWRQLPAPLHGAHAEPLVVALDLSTAITAGDLPPSRLLQARAKLAQLFAARGPGETALLVYADDAFAVAPLTEDAATLALYLDALSPEVMPVDGHRADRAIEQATRLLRQRGATTGHILLIDSDVDRAAIGEASTALRMGYRVSALGLGTPAGAAYRDDAGSLSHTRLDAASLEALAAAGGGHYRVLTPGDADLHALDVLTPASGGDVRASADRHGSGSGTVRWADQGYWFVLPLLLLVLLAFRRGSALAVIACLAVVPLLPAHAQSAVAEAPRGTLWQRDDQARHEHMTRGADAYRAGRHAEAARRWAALPGADAAYNRGNALARQGELDAAIAAYDEALRLQPGMPDAEANRAAVEAARARKPPPGPGADPRAPPRDRQQDSGRPTPGTGDPTPGDGPSTPDTPPADAPPSDPAETSRDAASAEPADQRNADAAQRERMQRALDAERDADDARDDTPIDGASQSDANGDERQQANEAWLRRLPDDPGGLLRAKFRLEHDRRQRQEGR